MAFSEDQELYIIDKLILTLYLLAFNQVICDSGFPTTAQSRVTINPSIVIVERGSATNSRAFYLLIVSTQIIITI